MKNEYFGDENDYYKYGLLRLITTEIGLKIGICFMRTPNEGQDGNKTNYLSKPEIWRNYDAPLFDWLKECVHNNNRQVTYIKDYLSNCVSNFEEIIQDDREQRKQYFKKFESLAKGCELLFFDPDNGIEIVTKPCGRKGSSKYLFLQEVKTFYDSGYSILIYQHHRRVKYDDFIQQIKNQILFEIGTSPFCIYRAKYTSLILLAKHQSKGSFMELNRAIEYVWEDKIRIYPLI